MNPARKNDIFLQIKVTLWWGVFIGMIAGAFIALYDTWYSNHYIQKGLHFYVLEIFSDRMITTVLVITSLFFVLGPVISIIHQFLNEFQSTRYLRISLIVGGFVFILGGYQLNTTEWFPAVFSLAGLIGNFVYSLICAGITIAVYRLLLKSRMPAPKPGRSFIFKLFGNKSLIGLLTLFLVFNLYAYWRILLHKPNDVNVVFITIDTLRADHLGCYGYEQNTSPTIDKLASEGILFLNTYSQMGLTWPSLTSIMTSMYPKTHGVLKNQWPLHGKYITLAEIFKNAGYKTGAFLANYYYAPNRGFDVKKGGEIGNLDKTVTRDAINWLKQIKPRKENFFMWVHYKNPHDPYTPPKPFTQFFDSTYTGQFDGSRPVLDSIFVNKLNLKPRDLGHIQSLYDAEIRSTDSYIARLLKKLEEMDVVNKTLIVFSADHGEELYDHNSYFFHGCSIYEGVLHIPLIMKFPEVLPSGKILKNQMESIDITPTILEFVRLPQRNEFEGHSALPVIFGETNGAWKPAFSQRSSTIFSIRTPEWKYIYNPDNYHTYCSRSDADQGDGYLIEAEELYQMQHDPKEQHNVVTEHPDIARDLRGQIIQWLNTNKREHKEQKLTKEAEERLRALGYIK